MSPEQEPTVEKKSVSAEILMEELKKSGLINMDAKISDLLTSVSSLQDTTIDPQARWGAVFDSDKYALIYR